MRQYFTGDGYTTPADQARSIGDRLFLGTRFWFYLKYIGVLSKSRALVRRNDYGDDNWAWASWEILTIVEQSGGRIEISGLDHLRNVPKPFVIVGNHMSTLETHLLPVMVLPITGMTFVVKKSLTKHFYFGPIMRACNPVAVSRINPRDDLVTVMREGQRILGEGRSLAIFPQSTRNRIFDPSQFNSLGAKLAEKAGVPLVPLALKTDFWDNGRLCRDIGPIRRRRTVHLEIGAPILPGTCPAREGHGQVVDFISQRLVSWGGEIAQPKTGTAN